MQELDQIKKDAQRFLQKGDFFECLRLYTKALSKDPKDAQLWASRAGVYNCKGDYEKALLDIEKSLELDSSFVQAYVIQGFSFYNLGLYKNSVESYSLALKVSKDSQQLKIKDLLEKSEKKLKDLESEQRVVNVESEILQNIIKKLGESDQFTQDLKDVFFLNSLELLTKSPQLSEMLGKRDARIKRAIQFLLEELDVENLGDKEMFVESTQTEQELRSQQEEFLKKQQRFYEKQQQDQKSKEQEEQQVVKEVNEEQREKYKEKVKEYTEKKREAKNLLEEGCYEQSLKICEEVLEVDENNFFLRNVKLGCLLKQEKWKEGQEYAEKSLEIFEKSQVRDRLTVSKIIHKYALFLWKNDLLREACATFERCLKICQSKIISEEFEKCQKELQEKETFLLRPELHQAKQKLELAQQLFQVGKIQEAQTEFEQSLQINPTTQAYIGLSNCLVKKKDFNLALEKVEQALFLQNTCVTAWAKKGFIHLILEQNSLAKASFELGLETDEKNSECLRGLARTKAIIQQNQKDSLTNKLKETFSNRPEVQEILLDEEFNNMLFYLSKNPSEYHTLVKDPHLQDKILTLVQAGLIKDPSEIQTVEEENNNSNQNTNKSIVMVSMGQEMNDPTVFDHIFQNNQNQNQIK